MVRRKLFACELLFATVVCVRFFNFMIFEGDRSTNLELISTYTSDSVAMFA